MRNANPLPRFLALFLALSLALPSPAHALRVGTPAETGLEEVLSMSLISEETEFLERAKRSLGQVLVDASVDLGALILLAQKGDSARSEQKRRENSELLRTGIAQIALRIEDHVLDPQSAQKISPTWARDPRWVRYESYFRYRIRERLQWIHGITVTLNNYEIPPEVRQETHWKALEEEVARLDHVAAELMQAEESIPGIPQDGLTEEEWIRLLAVQEVGWKLFGPLGRYRVPLLVPSQSGGGIFQPSNLLDSVIALKRAGVNARSTVLDLGAGLGHPVFAAASVLGARAMGVDLSPGLLRGARMWRNGLRKKGLLEKNQVKFRRGDLFDILKRLEGKGITHLHLYELPSVPGFPFRERLDQALSSKSVIESLGPQTRLLLHPVEEDFPFDDPAAAQSRWPRMLSTGWRSVPEAQGYPYLQFERAAGLEEGLDPEVRDLLNGLVEPSSTTVHLYRLSERLSKLKPSQRVQFVQNLVWYSDRKEVADLLKEVFLKEDPRVRVPLRFALLDGIKNDPTGAAVDAFETVFSQLPLETMEEVFHRLLGSINDNEKLQTLLNGITGFISREAALEGPNPMFGRESRVPLSREQILLDKTASAPATLTEVNEVLFEEIEAGPKGNWRGGWEIQGPSLALALEHAFVFAILRRGIELASLREDLQGFLYGRLNEVARERVWLSQSAHPPELATEAVEIEAGFSEFYSLIAGRLLLRGNPKVTRTDFPSKEAEDAHRSFLALQRNLSGIASKAKDRLLRHRVLERLVELEDDYATYLLSLASHKQNDPQFIRTASEAIKEFQKEFQAKMKLKRFRAKIRERLGLLNPPTPTGLEESLIEGDDLVLDRLAEWIKEKLNGLRKDHAEFPQVDAVLIQGSAMYLSDGNNRLPVSVMKNPDLVGDLDFEILVPPDQQRPSGVLRAYYPGYDEQIKTDLRGKLADSGISFSGRIDVSVMGGPVSVVLREKAEILLQLFTDPREHATADFVRSDWRAPDLWRSRENLLHGVKNYLTLEQLIGDAGRYWISRERLVTAEDPVAEAEKILREALDSGRQEALEQILDQANPQEIEALLEHRWRTTIPKAGLEENAERFSARSLELSDSLLRLTIFLSREDQDKEPFGALLDDFLKGDTKTVRWIHETLGTSRATAVVSSTAWARFSAIRVVLVYLGSMYEKQGAVFGDSEFLQYVDRQDQIYREVVEHNQWSVTAQRNALLRLDRVESLDVIRKVRQMIESDRAGLEEDGALVPAGDRTVSQDVPVTRGEPVALPSQGPSNRVVLPGGYWVWINGEKPYFNSTTRHWGALVDLRFMSAKQPIQGADVEGLKALWEFRVVDADQADRHSEWQTLSRITDLGWSLQDDEQDLYHLAVAFDLKDWWDFGPPTAIAPGPVKIYIEVRQKELPVPILPQKAAAGLEEGQMTVPLIRQMPMGRVFVYGELPFSDEVRQVLGERLWFLPAGEKEARAGLEEAGLNRSDMVLTELSLGGQSLWGGIASLGTPVVALPSEMVPTLTVPELAGLEEAARRQGTVLNVNRIYRQYGDQLLLEAA